MKSSVYTLALLASAAIACPALADDAAGSAVVQTSSTADSSTPPTNPGDIVVTGTRRATNLHDVPISISAISGEKMVQLGFKSAQELQYAVPGLSYNPQLGAGFLIRGLGTQGFDYDLDKAVGVVVDDVVQGMPRDVGFNTFSDLDHIEVLKGPQGTLFGKNATAGVVYVETARPKLGVYSLDGSIRVGERNEVRVEDTVNLPINSTMAARISGVYQRQDGFLHNDYDNSKGGGYRDYGVRGKLLWKPSSAFEAYLIGDVQNHHDGGLGGLGTVRSLGTYTSVGYPTNPASGYLVDFPSLLAAYGITAGADNKSYAHNSRDEVFTNQKDVSAHFKIGIGDYTITAITAFEHVKSGSWFDQDYTQTNWYNLNNSVLRSRQWSQEVRLNSPTGGFLDYMVGLYAYDVKTSAYDRSAGTLGQNRGTNVLYSYSGAMMDYAAHNQSLAAFGEANFHLTSKLTATGGLRFTYDHVHADYHPSQDIYYTFVGPAPAAANGGTDHATNLSGKATIKWEPTNNLMFYGTYSRGYKAPAIGVGTYLVFLKPETVNNFEIGARANFFDRKVTINATLFDEKFKNFQTTVSVLGDDGLTRSKLSNVPGLLSRGVEGDITIRPTSDFSFGGSFSYAPTKYEGFNAPCYSGQVVQATASQGACYKLGTGSALDASGLPSIQAPKFTFSVNGSYNPQLSERLKLFTDVTYYHRSSSYSQAGNPYTIVGAYGLLNMNIGIGKPDGSIKLSVYARNLLNKLFWSRYGTMTFAPAGSYLQYASSEGARTVGVRLDYHF